MFGHNKILIATLEDGESRRCGSINPGLWQELCQTLGQTKPNHCVSMSRRLADGWTDKLTDRQWNGLLTDSLG